MILTYKNYGRYKSDRNTMTTIVILRANDGGRYVEVIVFLRFFEEGVARLKNKLYLCTVEKTWWT